MSSVIKSSLGAVQLKGPLSSINIRSKSLLCFRKDQIEEMGDMYNSKQYSEGRPTYPQELFQFIASKTPSRDLVWDVGTGTGQAAKSLSSIYKYVIATDNSQMQLEYAAKQPNVKYVCTPPNMSISELEQCVSSQGSVDLVTVATAMHWFDLSTFYQQVKWILKKPHGVIAAWTYALPQVDSGTVNSILRRLFFSVDVSAHVEAVWKLVEDNYRSIEFPFFPVDGCDHTGPFEFKAEMLMDLDAFFNYIKSWSSYKTAKSKGIELLTNDVVDELTRVWNQDGKIQKLVTFPIYLRIGEVGN